MQGMENVKYVERTYLNFRPTLRENRPTLPTNSLNRIKNDGVNR